MKLLVTLLAMGLSACAATIPIAHVEFTPQHADGLVLFNAPILPLPDKLVVQRNAQMIAPQRNWWVNELYLVPLNGVTPAGREIRMVLIDHRMGTRNPSLQYYNAPGYVAPSRFFELSLPPGRYAITRLWGGMSTQGMTWGTLDDCMLSAAPVFEVRAGVVSVLDLTDAVAPVVPSSMRPPVVDEAQRLLAEYPAISATTAAPVSMTETVSLPQRNGNSCRLAM